MEKEVITFGRYKNKTFEEVYYADKNYCKLILTNHGMYRGNTEKFRDFLSTKFFKIGNKYVDSSQQRLKIEFPHLQSISSIDEIRQAISEISLKTDDDDKSVDKLNSSSVSQFFKKFRDEHLIEFYKIVGERPIKYQKLHEISDLRITNGALGLFYGLIFRKYAWNLKNEDAYDTRCEPFIRFPISLKFDYENYVNVNVPVMKYFEESILSDVNSYLDRYYLKQDNVEQEILHVLRLIYGKKMSTLNGLSILLNEEFFFFQKERYVELLKKCMFFYSFCKEKGIHDVYGDNKSLKEKFGFLKFLKYVQSYRVYEKYRGHIIDIVDDLINVTQLVQLHYDRDDEEKLEYSKIDLESIHKIMLYIDNTKNELDTCVVYPHTLIENFIHDIQDENVIDYITFPEDNIKVERHYVYGECDLFKTDTLIRIKYSKLSKLTVIDFFPLILYGVLFPSKCKILAIYNAYLGEQTSMEMIENITEVEDFIRKYNDQEWLKDAIENTLTKWRKNCSV